MRRTLSTRRDGPRHFALATVIALTAGGCGPVEDDAGAAAAADALGSSDAASAAHQLLDRAVGYHDAGNAWGTFAGTLQFEELRPDGSARRVEVELDVPASSMIYRGEIDGRVLVREVGEGVCRATVDGREPSEAEVAELSLTCDRLERTRNYYHYLWGLPMKLRDPGTIVDPEVERTTFQNQEVDQLRVTYDPEVGGDTWYFYFEPATTRLVGYRFYHDEAQNDGEYITLEGEREVDGMRIPANRRWYVNADDRFLGEDRLIQATAQGN